jgi:hypothetical protein
MYGRDKCIAVFWSEIVWITLSQNPLPFHESGRHGLLVLPGIRRYTFAIDDPENLRIVC